MNRAQRIEAEAVKLLSLRDHPGVDMSELRAAVDMVQAPWEALFAALAAMPDPAERARWIQAAAIMWPPP